MQHPMAQTDGAFAPGTRPVRPPMGQGRTHARKIGGIGRPSVQMKYAKNTAHAKPIPQPTPAFYHVSVIEAKLLPNNIASVRVLERIVMTQVALVDLDIYPIRRPVSQESTDDRTAPLLV